MKVSCQFNDTAASRPGEETALLLVILAASCAPGVAPQHAIRFYCGRLQSP